MGDCFLTAHIYDCIESKKVTGIYLCRFFLNATLRLAHGRPTIAIMVSNAYAAGVRPFSTSVYF
ncbi:MAG: hypothetical protein KME29_20565 [Calothrix sp. FI2-JRJ7]|nr:hypothetical protein [Calothrix sp. FI2-JRJ7]